MRTSAKLLFPLVAISLAGAALVIYSTRWGPGVGSDSTTYIVSARNLVAGRGLGLIGPEGNFNLMPYFAPFYSLVLSLFTTLGLDTVVAARWISIICFSLTIFFTGWTVARYTRRNWLGWLIGLLVATSPIMIQDFSWAMSEPIFITCVTGGLAFLLLYLEQPRKSRLVASALILGVGFLTRYQGVALVGVGCLAILGLQATPWSRRLRDLILFSCLSVLPMLVWVVIDIMATGTLGSRSSQTAPILPQVKTLITQMADVFWSWLPMASTIQNRLPEGIYRLLSVILPVVLITLCGAIYVFSWRKIPKDYLSDPSFRLVSVYALGMVFSLLVLAATYLLTYPPISINSRMLLVVYLLVCVSIAGLCAMGLQNWPWFRTVALIFCVAVTLTLFSDALRTRITLIDYHENGIGYTGRYWREITAIQAVRQLPANIPIISNETAAILFLTGRSAYPIDELFKLPILDEADFYTYGDDLSEKSQKVFVKNGGALVLFESLIHDLGAMYGGKAALREDILTRGLFLYFQGNNNSRIYFYHKPGEAMP
jgi:Dolichyl-phosphate-mannose-protein mannosyltransferase